MRALVFVALSVLCAARPAAAARFSVEKLAVDGEVLSVVPADLDGDGKRDLVVAFKRGQSPHESRFFALFWNRGGAFAAHPDRVLPADARTCAFDVADVDDAAGAELLVVSHHGVDAISFRGREPTAPRALSSDPTLFYEADRGALPHLRLVYELSAPGSHDLLVPLLDGLGVYFGAHGRYQSAARLAVELKSTLDAADRPDRTAGAAPRFSISVAFPSVHVADADGDGVADVIVALEDRVAMFRQHRDHTFDRQPAVRRDFALRSADELSESYSSASASVTDVDGDGVADLLLRKQVSHGITSAQATSYLFLGRRGGGWGKQADQIIKSDGVGFAEADLVDLTGDGRPDLLVPSVTMGVWAIIRVLTTKTLKVNLRLFPFGKDRRFAETPIDVRELKLKVPLSGNADLQAVEVGGDYNGDRRADLAFGLSDQQLAIFTGVGGGVMTKEPVETVAANGCGQTEPVDLDAQGKSDLVIHYASTPGHRGDVVVLHNRGSW